MSDPIIFFFNMQPSMRIPPVPQKGSRIVFDWERLIIARASFGWRLLGWGEGRLCGFLFSKFSLFSYSSFVIQLVFGEMRIVSCVWGLVRFTFGFFRLCQMGSASCFVEGDFFVKEIFLIA